MKRLVVLGAGAIGGGIGGMLARAGLDTALIARGAHGEAIRSEGLTVKTPEEAFTLALPCFTHPSEVDWREGDVAMVATKLNDAEAAYDDLLAAAGPELPVIVAQNGIIGETWARARFTEVWPTMVWVPNEHLVPGEVCLFGRPVPGAVDVGESGAALQPWLQKAGFRSTVRKDVKRWQHAKWVTNLVGSAIVLGRGDMVRGLMDEGHAVLAAAGLDAANKAELKAYIGDVTLGTIDDKERLAGGSTGQSHARGKALEVAWLNVPMAALGRDHGVPTPLNDAIIELAQHSGGRPA